MSRLSRFIHTHFTSGQLLTPEATSDRKPPLVLHVGPHKTGSTAIQSFCERNRKQLAKAGLWYPKVGIHGAQHMALPGCYLSQHPFIPDALRGGCPEEIIATMAAEVPRGLTPLLSSEIFWELVRFQPEAFESVAALLGRRYQVFVAFVERPVRERSWSGIKHLSRSGYACDPVADFHSLQESQRYAEERLRKIGCPVIRVPYDEADCISPFLKSLSSQLISTQMVRPGQLDALITKCHDAPKLRKNVAPSERWCVAFTVELSRRLVAAKGRSKKYDDRIASFVKKVMAIGGDLEAARRLPDEDVVFHRVVRAGGSLACLLTPTEVQAWESIFEHPVVQVAAISTGCRDEFRAISQPRSQQRLAA